MVPPLVLASASEIRARMLAAVGLPPEIRPARIDEEAIRAALQAEGASPRDQADALAEMKARKISEKFPESMVLGCDQLLALGDRIFAKPETPDAARAQLADLAGKTHQLLSAAVVYRGGVPLWRHVGLARLSLHPLSQAEIAAYVDAHWDSIRHAVGAYKIEEAGARLMARIEGCNFTIQGLPLVEFLTWLRQRGEL